MQFLLIDGLDAVAEHLPRALVDEEARSALERIARRIPPVATSFGFECRLRKGSPGVDLGFPVEGNEGRAALASGELPPGFEVDDAWQRIRALCQRWIAPDSRMHVWVPFLCFEVDGAEASKPVPAPSLFVTLDSPLVRPPGQPAEQAPEIEAMGEALPVLCGEAAPELETRLVSCFSALPDAARLLHVGVMLGRGLVGVRLSVTAPRPAVVPYLEKCGWSAPVLDLEEALRRHVDELAPVQFDFDVGASGVRPRLGLGLAPRDEPAWHQLLGRLVADGLCSASKRRALLQWPGVSMSALEGVGPCVLRRYLSHVKLGCSPGQAPEAKAYFGVEPRRSLVS